MKTVTLREFRRDAERIIELVQRGERLILTRRGKPVVRLEPIVNERIPADDPLYSIAEVAESGESLDNTQIDDLLYGQ